MAKDMTGVSANDWLDENAFGVGMPGEMPGGRHYKTSFSDSSTDFANLGDRPFTEFAADASLDNYSPARPPTSGSPY